MLICELLLMHEIKAALQNFFSAKWCVYSLLLIGIAQIIGSYVCIVYPLPNVHTVYTNNMWAHL